MAGEARLRAIAFAAQLAGACAGALGGRAVAVYVHGSLTLGDFTPGRSDVDLLLVVEGPLAQAERRALQEAVDALRDAAPSRVDLRVVTRAVAASPTPAPAMEAAFTLRPGQPAEVETRVAGEPDLVVELSIVRAHGRAIVGPGPRTVVGAVPDAWVDAVGARQLAAWADLADDAPHAELMVLTSCRIWRFHAERVYCSKAAAGRWALARDPSLTAVVEALRQREDDPTTTIAEDGIRRVIGVVRRALG